MNARRRVSVLVGVVALFAAVACTPEENQAAFTGDIAQGNPTAEEAEDAAASGEAPDPLPLTNDEEADLQAALESSPTGCDVLSTRSCLLPFPSDDYTVEDTASATGRRVDLPDGLTTSTRGFDSTHRAPSGCFRDVRPADP